MAQANQNKEKNITILGTETDFTGELTFRDNLVIEKTPPLKWRF